MTSKQNIRLLSPEDLKPFFNDIGEKSFRAKQVHEWLWKKSAQSFDDMTNLSKQTREKLKESFSIPAVTIKSSQISSDKTIKNAF